MKSIKIDDELEEIKETQNKTNNGSTLSQKLTLILLIAICSTIVYLSYRVVNHNNIINNNALPEDSVETGSYETEEPEPELFNEKPEVEYVDEVVYNPSELGQQLSDIQNNYKVSKNTDDLMGNDAWYCGSSDFTWNFMSGYDYRKSKIDCIWICTDNNTTEILAYRTAVYNGATNEFEDASISITEQGGALIEAD